MHRKRFFLGQRIITTVIVLNKDDVFVGLIIESYSSKRIQSKHQGIQSAICQQAEPISSVNKQSNFIINHTSLYLSCIRLIKVTRSLNIKNYMLYESM